MKQRYVSRERGLETQTDSTYKQQVFNVGNLRRVNKASQQLDQSANFFDPDNKDGNKIRDELAIMVLDQLIDWLRTGGRVAIHDATNSTVQRRKLLIDRLQQEPDIKVLILESVCTDKTVRNALHDECTCRLIHLESRCLSAISA